VDSPQEWEIQKMPWNNMLMRLDELMAEDQDLHFGVLFRWVELADMSVLTHW
jgi:hypothetical protein